MFIFGSWVLIALLSAAVTTGLALKKGLPMVKWFFIGLGASIFGVVAVFLQKGVNTEALPAGLAKVAITASPTKCPVCGSANHPSATICTNCGSQLNPVYETEVARLKR